MRYLLLYHVNRIQPELANRCRNYSFDETISECLQWNSSVPQKPTSSSLNLSICNFCKNKGHRVEECRKKKKKEKNKTSKLDNHGHKNVLSLNNNQHDYGYQLDAAANLITMDIKMFFLSIITNMTMDIN